MKKFILLLLMCIAVLGANAQKIDANSSENGVRTVSTTWENVRAGMTDKMVMYANLSYLSSNGSEGSYFLGIKLTAQEVIHFVKGGRILIKTTNGDVLTLTNAGGSIVNDLKNIGGFNVYETQTIFPVTPEQIAQISSGVVKVRVELEDGKVWEKEYKKDKIGKVIAKDYSLITDALKSDPSTSFTEGF